MQKMKLSDLFPETDIDNRLVFLLGDAIRPLLGRLSYRQKFLMLMQTYYAGYEFSLSDLIRIGEVPVVERFDELGSVSYSFVVVKNMTVMFNQTPQKVIKLCPLHHLVLGFKDKCPQCGTEWRERGLKPEYKRYFTGIISDGVREVTALYVGVELPRGWVLGALVDAFGFYYVARVRGDNGWSDEVRFDIVHVLRSEPLVGSVVGVAGVTQSSPVPVVKSEDGEEKAETSEDVVVILRRELARARLGDGRLCADDVAERYGLDPDVVEKSLVDDFGLELDEEGCVVLS